METNVIEIDTRARSNHANRLAIAPRWIRPTDFAAATGMHRRSTWVAIPSGGSSRCIGCLAEHGSASEGEGKLL